MEALIGEVEDVNFIREDRGTHLSVRSDKDDVDKRSDNKHPVTNVFGRMINEVQRKEEPPTFVEEKRFMVYICGGYKGKNE